MRLRAGISMFAVLLALPGYAQLRTPGHYALAREHVARAVARALLESGVEIAAPRVELLAEAVATEPFPVLEVRSTMLLATREGETQRRRVAVKLACRVPGRCVPFYAVVNWPEGTRLPETAVRGEGETLRSTEKAKMGTLLRAGAHARLMLNDGQMRLQVPVIVLENAGSGQRVRVASLDRKRTYMAEAIGPGLLQGAF